MLRFLKSLVNWTAKNHGVAERPMGFKVNTPNTPSIPTTSAPQPSPRGPISWSLSVSRDEQETEAGDDPPARSS